MILNINNLVQIQILPGVEAVDGSQLTTEFCSYFTTEMSPMYAAAYDIRRLIGAYITEIPDDAINQLILEWSFLAQDINNYDIADIWLRYANKWVAYKAALVILYNTKEYKDSILDKESKQLGDLSVSKSAGRAQGTGLIKLVDWLECEAYKYEFSVKESRAPMMECLGLKDKDALPYIPKLAMLAEKGQNDPEKDPFGRRWITDSGGEPLGNNEIYINRKKYKTNLGTRSIYDNRSF